MVEVAFHSLPLLGIGAALAFKAVLAFPGLHRFPVSWIFQHVEQGSEKLCPGAWRSPLASWFLPKKKLDVLQMCCGCDRWGEIQKITFDLGWYLKNSLPHHRNDLVGHLARISLNRKHIKPESFITFRVCFRKSFPIRFFWKPNRHCLFPLDCSSIQRRYIHFPNIKRLPVPFLTCWILSQYLSNLWVSNTEILDSF